DEIASIVAGAEPMKEGLKKLHAAMFPWVMYWGMEIQGLVDKGVVPPIGEGFEKFLAAPDLAPEFEKAILAQIAEEKTEPYDSHPALGERIAAIERLPKIAMRADSDIAADLLENPLEVEQKFLRSMNPKLREKAFNFVEWR